ncbi:unnamed protein product, partial [Polarella glacialis]
KGQALLCCRALARCCGPGAREESLAVELELELLRGGGGAVRRLRLLAGAAGGDSHLPSVDDLLGRSSRTCPLPLLHAAAEQRSTVAVESSELESVLASNCLGRGGAEAPEQAAAGLWPLPSMCNHCDQPNMTYSLLGRMLVLRAARDIKQGEELCISYTGWDKLDSERKEKLCVGWGVPRPPNWTPSKCEAKLKAIPQWLQCFRQKHGVAAAKDAIIAVCQDLLGDPTAGPARATAFRLQAAYCLQQKDFEGAVAGACGVADAAAE